MEIKTKKSYDKMYEKLSIPDRIIIKEALLAFHVNPFDPSLRNHSLKGKYEWSRSIDAKHDLRIIFIELSDGKYELISLTKVGTHSQLYGK